MALTLAVHVDWDSDGAFNTASEDISAYVQDVNFKRGIDDPLARVADIGACTITVYNGDRRFSPAFTGGPLFGLLKPGLAVRVMLKDGPTVYPLFRGYTRAFEPQSGQFGEQRAYIECADILQVMQDHALALPLQTGQRMEYLLRLILANTFRGGLAQALIGLTANPTAGDTLSVSDQNYTFQATPGSNPNQVKIGANAEGSVDNAVAAINGALGAGDLYGTGTLQPTGVVAEASRTYQRGVKDSRAIRYYRLGETGGATALDSGLNGQNATHQGSPAMNQPGAFAPNTAVYFDGVNDYVSLPTINLANHSYSIEAWIRPDANPPGDQAIFGMFDSYASGKMSFLWVKTDGSIYHTHFMDDLQTAAGLVPFGGPPTHVVMIYDYLSNIRIIYVNGVWASQNTAGPLTDTDPVCTIGADTGGALRFFKGVIDEVVIYDKVLHVDRVAVHHAAGPDAYEAIAADAPIRHYRLEERTGTQAHDFASNQTGTYTGSPLLGVNSLVPVETNPVTALRFDGVNDYVSLPAFSLNGMSWTVEMWIRPSSQMTNIAFLFLAKLAATTGLQGTELNIILWPGTGVLRLSYRDMDLLTDAEAVAYDVWSHIACTYDANTGLSSIYINGVLAKSAAMGIFSGSFAIMELGRWPGDDTFPVGFYYKGAMSDTAIYGAALSAERIQAHYYTASSVARRLAILADNPLRWYRLSEAGGTAAVELTSAQHGTVSGSPLRGVAGPFAPPSFPDTAASFNGVNAYVSVPTIALANSSFSIEAWVKPATSGYPAEADIYSLDASSGGTNDRIRLILYADGHLILAFRGDNLSTAAGLVVFGGWNSIAVTYDASLDVSRIYVNGSLVTQGNNGPLTSTNYLSSNIGAFGNGASNLFKGDIDEVAIYDYALGAAAVSRHHGAGLKRYSEMQADFPRRFYRLGERAGETVAVDHGADRAHGTYVGGVTLGVAGVSPAIYDPDGAVLYDGVNDTTSVPALDLKKRSFSITMWLKLDRTPGVAQVPIQIRNNAGVYLGLLVVYEDGRWAFHFEYGVRYVDANTFRFGVWNHLVITYDHGSGLGCLYLNGKLAPASSPTDVGEGYTGDSDQIWIGSQNGAGNWVKGYIDEVSVHWEALTADRVAALFAMRRNPVGIVLRANARGAWANSLWVGRVGVAPVTSSYHLEGGTDGPPGLAAIEAGTMTIDVAGDQWSSGDTNALDAATDVLETERGLLWVDRQGRLQVKNRDWEYARSNAPAAVTISSDHNQLEFIREADLLYNRVVVGYTPRGTLATGVVAKASSTITVPGQGGNERWSAASDLDASQYAKPEAGLLVTTLPYVEQTGGGRLIGAKSINRPLRPGVDYTIWDNPGGAGAGISYTNAPPETINWSMAITGSGIEFSFRNRAIGSLYFKDLVVYGQGIVAYDRQEAVVEDTGSMDAYGRRTLTLDLPLTGDQQFAQTLARYFLNRFKQPAPRVARLAFDDGIGLLGGVSLLGLDIGDVIAVSDYQTGVTAHRYLITGIEVTTIQPGIEKTMDIAFTLRRMDDVPYLILDDPVYGLPNGVNCLSL